MSLTALLKGSFGKEFRERLLKDFPTPKFDMGTGIMAIPDDTVDYQLSGAAYDYLLRFAIERITPKSKIQKFDWVALKGYNALLKRLKETKAQKIMSRDGKMIYDVKELKLFLRDRFEKAVENYNRFLKADPKKTDFMIEQEMCDTCVFLAKLDLFYRRNFLHAGFYNEDIDTAIDTKLMYKMTDLSHFKAKKMCYLNPKFGQGCFVGGSDADLIIDDALIDIKTTKKEKLQRLDFNQILGYYILSLIGGVNINPELKPIKRIGIYFARFGMLWTIPINEIGSKKKFEDVKEYLIAYPPYIEMMKHINDTSKYEKLTENILQNE